ncbi:serine/threonine-protein kinase BLUS1-like [Andrographis paniculata]|uniref:serine/threonine-protein kinase BLUS1-like n=1 Tax=Andrographis paniculata TaxID=175694 RepID=UPI0021E72700|nr:serine/threonine-protein kinase BLUS1-like [Andrographis paniculata]
MEKERKKYPTGAEHYTLYEEVGTGVSASVYRALCNTINEIVAIKILDFERNNSDLNSISREAQTMILVDHPNVLKSLCSFISDHNLWVVMPYMAGGSCLHILKVAHPDGFEEVVIATILREVLKGLEYLHEHGHIHRDVKAGNILIDSRGGIKLGDFGVSAYLFDSGDRQRMRNTFVGTPCWMAPEVMEQSHGYDFKADIWSFGITALELAHGHAPFSKYPPMKVLLMTLQHAPPSLDYERDKKFSKSFKQMIASCLVKEPSKRPSASKLLKHSFFKQARSNDYIVRHLLEGLPGLGDRVKALKVKEQDMLAQKKIPDGEKEEISQNEYKRGISHWDFDLDDLKAQAAMIQDDDSVVEKDEDTPTKRIQRELYFARQCSFGLSDDNAPTSNSSVNSSSNIAECEKLNDSASITTSTSGQQTTHMVHSSKYKAGNCSVENFASELNRGLSGVHSNTNQSPIKASSIAEVHNKVSKPSVNGHEVDEKVKTQVVQQKGRFKVTSGNVEALEKTIPSLIIPKTHSMQVTSETPVSAPVPTILAPASAPVSAVSSPLCLGSTPSNSCSTCILPTLNSILQANIAQRENILKVMKQISVGTSSGSLPTNSTMEKSALEIAHDREKELINELTDLRLRFVRTQEELQKYKNEKARENNS